MTTLNFEMALAHVISSFEEGAQLRIKVASDCGRAIVEAATLVAGCLRSGGKILFCGNGGSAADAQHLAAEFVGRFILDRQALPAIALTTDSSILTAVGNDYGFEQVFSRQIQALGRPGDVAIGISTSGHSPGARYMLTESACEHGCNGIKMAYAVASDFRRILCGAWGCRSKIRQRF